MELPSGAGRQNTLITAISWATVAALERSWLPNRLFSARLAG
jgi:hypothetical protein